MEILIFNCRTVMTETSKVDVGSNVFADSARYSDERKNTKK